MAIVVGRSIRKKKFGEAIATGAGGPPALQERGRGFGRLAAVRAPSVFFCFCFPNSRSGSEAEEDED